MSDHPNFIHAGALVAVTADRCSWRWSFEDVHLRCDDTRLPFEDLCADHYIAEVQAVVAAEKASLFSPEWRRFPPTPITPEENTE